MAKKLYEESNIREIGNALRRKLGNTRIESFDYRGMEVECNTNGDHTFKSSTKISGSANEVFQVTPAAKWLVNLSVKGGSVYIAPAYYNKLTGEFPYSSATEYKDAEKLQLTFEGKQCISILASCSWDGGSSVYKQYGYHIQLVALDADGNPLDFTEQSNHYSMRDVTLERDVSNTFKTSAMASAVDSIEAGSGTESTFTTKNITENGTYSASTDDGVDGYSSVTVDVHDVHVDKEFTENGVYYPSNDGADGYGTVTVNVGFSPNLQAKTEYITENGISTIRADAGYDGLGAVTVSVNVAGEGGGGSSGYANIEFDAGLDDFTFVHENSSGHVTFLNYGLSFTTKKVWGNSTTYYAFHPDGSTAVVGDNVMDHMKYTSFSTSSSYAHMGFYYQSSSSTTPTWDNIRTYSGTGLVYRFGSVTISGDTHKDYWGNLVACDRDGLILFIGTWDEVAAALNNGSINTTKGVVLLSTQIYKKTQNYVKQGTITFNAIVKE